MQDTSLNALKPSHDPLQCQQINARKEKLEEKLNINEHVKHVKNLIMENY